MKNDTKYATIYAYILDYMKQKGLKNGDKLPTEKQISEQFGASRVTVRRAIKELCDRNIVYRVQGGGTYVGASSMHRNSNNVHIIPFVISGNVNSYSQMVQGAENYLSQHYCYLTVHCSDGSYINERNIIQNLVAQNTRSMIVLPCDANKNFRFYFELMQKGIQIVFVDIMPNGLTGHYVSSDNLMGGYQATKYLLSKGYTKIAAFCDSVEKFNTVEERKKGYLLALQEAGIKPREEYMPKFREICAEIPDAVQKLMKSPNPPDAFFATNDIIAIHILITMQRLGYHVPGDAAIIGFDNLEISVMQSVPLTTMAQNFVEIGRSAASLCMELDDKPPHVFYRKMVPVSVVERMSTQLTL